MEVFDVDPQPCQDLQIDIIKRYLSEVPGMTTELAHQWTRNLQQADYFALLGVLLLLCTRVRSIFLPPWIYSMDQEMSKILDVIAVAQENALTARYATHGPVDDNLIRLRSPAPLELLERLEIDHVGQILYDAEVSQTLFLTPSSRARARARALSPE